MSKLVKVYVGADRACRCGCKGKYHQAGTYGAKVALNRLMHQHSMFPVECERGLVANEWHMNLSLPNNRAVTAYFCNEVNLMDALRRSVPNV